MQHISCQALVSYVALYFQRHTCRRSLRPCYPSPSEASIPSSLGYCAMFQVVDKFLEAHVRRSHFFLFANYRCWSVFFRTSIILYVPLVRTLCLVYVCAAMASPDAIETVCKVDLS